MPGISGILGSPHVPMAVMTPSNRPWIGSLTTQRPRLSWKTFVTLVWNLVRPSKPYRFQSCRTWSTICCLLGYPSSHWTEGWKRYMTEWFCTPEVLLTFCRVSVALLFGPSLGTYTPYPADLVLPACLEDDDV